MLSETGTDTVLAPPPNWVCIPRGGCLFFSDEVWAKDRKSLMPQNLWARFRFDFASAAFFESACGCIFFCLRAGSGEDGVAHQPLAVCGKPSGHVGMALAPAVIELSRARKHGWTVAFSDEVWV